MTFIPPLIEDVMLEDLRRQHANAIARLDQTNIEVKVWREALDRLERLVEQRKRK